MRRLVGLVAVLVLALVATACQLEAVVEVTVDEDGSGVVDVGVALDDAAVERAGDLEQLVAVDDLVAAGWTVTPPTVEGDGRTWLRASKPFGGPEELGTVLAEVSPVFDLDLDRNHRFGQTSLRLDGTIDLSDGLDSLGDDQLQQLFGSAAGVDIAAIEDEVGPLAENTQLRFTVTMPYDVDANGRVDGEQAEWVVRPGDAAVDIEADATQRHTLTLVFGVAAVVLLLAALFVVGRRFWRIYTGADLELDAPRPTDGLPAVEPVDEPPDRQLELIVVDAFGVLFDAGGDLTDLLAPFVVEHGGTDDPVVVAERHRQASLGRLSTAELWAVLGVEGDPEQLDRALADRIQLTDGALTFLERSTLQGLTIVCLANGVATWVDLLRRRDNLDVYCKTWVLSSDLAVRKPDRGAYEAVRAATGVPLGNCLMIDDRREHLDAARRLGMSTALFGDGPDESGQHPRLDSFETLLGETAR